MADPIIIIDTNVIVDVARGIVRFVLVGFVDDRWLVILFVPKHSSNYNWPVEYSGPQFPDNELRW